MSPPIYTPDGSEVSEIVLPDGSTASEVIGPDGNVVFEAAPDIPDSVVDNFEEIIYEDENNTVSDYYTLGGDATDFNWFSRSTSAAYEGSYGIDGDNNTNNDYTVTSVDGDGLPRYPTIDDRFRISVNMSDSSDDLLWIGTTIGGPATGDGLGSTTGYGIEIRPDRNNLAAIKFTGSDRSALNSTAYTPPANQWIDAEIYPQSDGTVSVAIFETPTDNASATPDVSVSGSDGSSPEYSDLGWGIEYNSSGSGNQSDIDNVRVIE